MASPLARWGGAMSAVAAVLMTGFSAWAAPITVNGITFSDELGGFRLVSATGEGLPNNPFVVVEEISGREPAVLVVRGLSQAFPHGVGTHRLPGFYLRKVVINRTGRPWSSFELELQETLWLPSDYLDGLSFDQAVQASRPFKSDRFARSVDVREPADVVRFGEGRVNHGDTVTLNVTVSDPTPMPIFYIVQTPQRVVESAAGDDEEGIPVLQRAALRRPEPSPELLEF